MIRMAWRIPYPRSIRARLVALVLGVAVPLVALIAYDYAIRLESRIALAALAPSSILQVPGAGQASFSKMRRLVTGLPCYSLQLGKQSERVPGMLEALLKALPDGGETAQRGEIREAPGA